ITSEEQEMTALYALGSLSQREARELELHLRESCAVCETELKEFEQVVDELGFAAEPVAPPAYLRDLLSVRIEREAADPVRSSASVIPFPEHPGAAQPKPASERSTLSRTFLPWAVAAALLIAFASIFTVWQSERRSLTAALNEERQAAAQQSAEFKEQLDRLDSKTTELAQINSVLSSPQWRMIPLAGQSVAPDSSGRVYWDLQGKRWVVTADLPPAPQGKVYQLWFVTPEAKISAGLINTDKKGHGFNVIEFPASAEHLAAAAITLEPEGGSQQPTSAIYVLGTST